MDFDIFPVFVLLRIERSSPVNKVAALFDVVVVVGWLVLLLVRALERLKLIF
jgi:hypothetical protein